MKILHVGPQLGILMSLCGSHGKKLDLAPTEYERADAFAETIDYKIAAGMRPENREKRRQAKNSRKPINRI